MVIPPRQDPPLPSDPSPRQLPAFCKLGYRCRHHMQVRRQTVDVEVFLRHKRILHSGTHLARIARGRESSPAAHIEQLLPTGKIESAVDAKLALTRFRSSASIWPRGWQRIPLASPAMETFPKNTQHVAGKEASRERSTHYCRGRFAP